MVYKIIGVQEVNYKNKENREVKGTSFYVTYENNSINGLGSDKLYISDRNAANMKMPLFKPGDTIDVLYNRYGSIESINYK